MHVPLSNCVFKKLSLKLNFLQIVEKTKLSLFDAHLQDFAVILCTLIVSPFFCQEICLTWLFFSISGHFQDKSSYILSYCAGGAPTKRGNPMSKISSKWSSRIWERESAANFKGATQLQTITTNNNTANWKKKEERSFCCGQSHFLHKKAY